MTNISHKIFPPLFLSFFLLLMLPRTDSLYFKIPRFDPKSQDIILQGDAVTSTGGGIELINKVNYLCRVGWATYPGRVPLWDSTTAADFATNFSFTIDTQNRTTYGHGIAFFLAAAGFQIPPNSAGGFIGLFNTTTADHSPSNQIVHVEFDIFPNPEWDPPAEHVGINVNSIASEVYTPWSAGVHSLDNVLVSISYDSKAKNLSVNWSYEKSSSYKEIVTSLSYKVDLVKVLPQWVTIGFSAATGQYGARHTLNSWEFNSTLDA
ncbi:Lectin [Parasponia andersonii]|uniref:Lectin n=1 Tax=Parasponia andersonii TaxID=3476 RepID=A0A2P5A862_PARAD|nr:Lectin [Parasponia andersonii]